MSDDIIVQVAGGTYRLSAPLELGPSDSGTNGHTVIWQAAPGERPVLNGGVPVSGWQLSDAAKDIWSATVPAGTTSRQLYVNGTRAVRARSALDPAGFSKTANGFTTSDGSYLSWTNVTGVEIVGRNAWKHLRCPLASITSNGSGGSNLNAAQPCWGNAGTAPNPDYYFPYNGSGRIGLDRITWIENARPLLDQAGEFYLDTAAAKVYYKPRTGEQMSAAVAEIPVAEQLVTFKGTPGQLVPANDNDSRISYQGSWVTSSGRTYGDMRDDVHATSANGDSATITFTGTGIDVLSERNSDQGDVDVYVDGTFDRTVSSYGTGQRLAQQVIYSRTGLSLGQHTVKLVKKSGGWLPIDGFVPVTAALSPVHDIAFRGISFTNTTWLQPSTTEGYADNQAGVVWVGSPHRISRTPGAVRVERGNRIEVSNAEFSHLGGAGADLAFGTQNSKIVGNLIHDVSGAGISVGEFDDFWLTDPARMTSGNTVSDNTVIGVARDFEDAAGVMIGFTRGSVVDHNEIANLPYSGLSIGWGWGWTSDGVTRRGTNYAYGNSVTNNYIHNVMNVLNDGGPIYTLGGQGDGSQRSVLSGNVLSKAGGAKGHGQALYHDEGSSWWDTHDNVVVQTGEHWNMEWIGTIHDINVHDNYTDNPKQNNSGTRVTITGTTVVSDGNWPAGAKAIRDAAGPRAPYKTRVPVSPWLGNDGEFGDFLAPVKIAYTGTWLRSQVRAEGDLNADVYYTSTNGDKVTFTFTGTGLSVLGERASDQGTLAMSVDGASSGTVDTYAAARQVRATIASVRDLPYGQHTLSLTKQAGSYATIDGYVAERSVDNTDPSIAYSGMWGRSADRGLGDFNNDVQYATQDGAAATFTWYGTGVDVVTEKNSDQGDVDVYVDGQFRQTISCANASRQVQQRVYRIDGLPEGMHAIKLVKKSGQYVVLDRFTVR